VAGGRGGRPDRGWEVVSGWWAVCGRVRHCQVSGVAPAFPLAEHCSETANQSVYNLPIYLTIIVNARTAVVERHGGWRTHAGGGEPPRGGGQWG
jgi:hypothetical protein